MHKPDLLTRYTFDDDFVSLGTNFRTNSIRYKDIVKVSVFADLIPSHGICLILDVVYKPEKSHFNICVRYLIETLEVLETLIEKIRKNKDK